MNPHLSLHYANLGAQIDRHGAALLGFLTAGNQAAQADPISSLSFDADAAAGSVTTKVHCVTLVGQFVQRFIAKDGDASLYGAIEFRQVDAEGLPLGEPVVSVWVDEYGSYGVSGKAGYVSMAHPSSAAAGVHFRTQVAGALFQKVQAILMDGAISAEG